MIEFVFWMVIAAFGGTFSNVGTYQIYIWLSYNIDSLFTNDKEMFEEKKRIHNVMGKKNSMILPPALLDLYLIKGIQSFEEHPSIKQMKQKWQVKRKKETDSE